MKALFLIAACALVGATATANASPYVVTVEQVGSDVVATGSGQIDLTGLVLNASDDPGYPGIFASWGDIGLGSGYTDTYTPSELSGPTGFGTGDHNNASSSTGSLVAFQDSGGGYINVPAGYVSDTVLSTSTDTFDDATFASLGVTPGTYVWTWGSDPDQSFTIDVEATPLPAALPLFATSLGGLGLLGWRRRRKAQAVA